MALERVKAWERWEDGGGGGEDRLGVEQLGGSGDETWLTVEGNVEPTVALADRPDG
jgi:hypothetical protein